MLQLQSQRKYGFRALRRGAVCAALYALLLAGCATAPVPEQAPKEGRIVCDSYLILHMCVRDLIGDGVVDMIYFSDTYEIFMYREGMLQTVEPVMPLHRCAVTLSEDMQALTNRILSRADLTVSEELVIMKDLLTNYMAAKPEIAACNARFDKLEQEGESGEEGTDDFFIEESEWDDL